MEEVICYRNPIQTLQFLTALPTRQDGVENRDKAYWCLPTLSLSLPLSPRNNFQIVISNLINVLTHQIFATKDNPAADPRQMRRIIAEDPDWLVNISIHYVTLQ